MTDSMSWLSSRPVWFVWLMVLGAVVAPLVTYQLGQRHAQAQPEPANCVAGDPVISCELDDGWTVGVPPDVLWGDSAGVDADGRPACLQPGDRIRTTLWVVPVEVDGMEWRHVLRVEC
ncbi:hypothetical protein ABTX24_03370 [Nocardioides sp. NPDC127514]|uniref:hypothetical protein n=1 Tax=unclassified Nocardioides TaxID=2615069 RepID=UPI00332C9614